MSEPTTEAGRALVEHYDGVLRFRDDIIAIENEARAEAAEGDHVHQGRWCRACVQHGSDVTLAGINEAQEARAAYEALAAVTDEVIG